MLHVRFLVNTAFSLLILAPNLELEKTARIWKFDAYMLIKCIQHSTSGFGSL